MAYNNYQQVPFWDFVRSFDQHGAGVDHPAHDYGFFGPPGPPPPPGAPGEHPHPPPFGGFGFGGPFWGRGGFGGPGGPGCRGGRRGRHGHRRDRSGSRGDSPSGENTDGEAREGQEPREGSPHGRRGPRHGRHGRGGPGGPGGPRGGMGGWGHGHGHGHGPHRGPPGAPPMFGGGPGSFDLSGLINALSAHPLAQTFRNYAEQAARAGAQQSGETLVPEDVDNESSFVPPVDVFSTEKTFVLHIALPGARKEDVGVNWDEEKGVLNVAGVVYRQGDEEFLKSLSQSERKVGVFERSVKLPPGNAEKEEIDGDNITAKLEDGVLVVTVPKVEKEWTEVKRVDIE